MRREPEETGFEKIGPWCPSPNPRRHTGRMGGSCRSRTSPPARCAAEPSYLPRLITYVREPALDRQTVFLRFRHGLPRPACMFYSMTPPFRRSPPSKKLRSLVANTGAGGAGATADDDALGHHRRRTTRRTSSRWGRRCGPVVDLDNKAGTAGSTRRDATRRAADGRSSTRRHMVEVSLQVSAFGPGRRAANGASAR